MNKKLLIAAVGAALVAGPMLAAHAAPTLYGKFNVGIASIDNGNNANNSTLAVTDDSSRLGVKGDEDLGGGLKVIYNMEMLYDADGSGAVSGGGRDVFVGLQGDWGSVKVGQYSTYHKAIQYPVEILGDSIADWTANGWQGDSRPANNIEYMSPNLSGFVFGIGSARGESGVDATESNPTTIGVSFKSGPVYVFAGMDDRDNQGAAGLDKATKFGGTFSFDAFLVGVAMQTQKSLGGSAEVDTTAVVGQYTFGNNSIQLTFATYDSTVANGDCDQTSLGFTHKLSKTTLVRGVYSTIDNETAATCSSRMISAAGVDGLASPTAGNDPSGFQAQIVFSF